MTFLATTTWGNPEAVRTAVCLHGITANGGTWSGVALRLVEQGYFVVAPDLRGHGNSQTLETNSSMVDMVEDIARTCLTEPTVLIGHSFGGALAVLAVARGLVTPDRLVLVDPALRLKDRDRAERTIAGERAAAAQDLAAVRDANPRWSAVDIANKVLSRQQANWSQVAAAFPGNVPWDLHANLAEVAARVPTLCITPTVSDYLADDEIQHIRALLGESLVQLVGVRHSVHRDDLEAFMAAFSH